MPSRPTLAQRTFEPFSGTNGQKSGMSRRKLWIKFLKIHTPKRRGGALRMRPGRRHGAAAAPTPRVRPMPRLHGPLSCKAGHRRPLQRPESARRRRRRRRGKKQTAPHEAPRRLPSHKALIISHGRIRPTHPRTDPWGVSENAWDGSADPWGVDAERRPVFCEK